MYMFGDLEAGCYRVRFEIPPGFSATTPNNGDDCADSDIDDLGFAPEKD